jgi:Na+/melibiose symporter-like transporter
VAAAGLGGLADALQSGVGFLIIDSYLGLGAAIGYILLQWALASTVGVWVAERMLRRMEKHHVMALAAALAAAVMLLNSLLAPDTPHVLWAYLVASFLQFVGGIVVDMCPQAMVGDIVDHDRMKTGVNRSGQYVAALTFVRKAVFGIGTSLAIFVAGSFGFEPGQAPYSPQAVFGLKLVGFWIPALCCALTALVMWRYPLDSRRHAIVCRRNGRMASKVEQGETMVARHPLEASRGAA